MAVFFQLPVTPATQDDFHKLDSLVEQSIMDAGGPPAGLMSHAVYPEGDGFVVANVWRTEADARRYVDDVVGPLLTELGLRAQEAVVRPVWSFARP